MNVYHMNGVYGSCGHLKGRHVMKTYAVSFCMAFNTWGMLSYNGFAPLSGHE